jgi:hypothetical protein
LLKVTKETELEINAPRIIGTAGRILGTLANAGVNLRAFCARPEGKNITFLLVTNDNDKAEKSLKAAGFNVKRNEVISTLVRERIGVASEIALLLENAVVQIEYCYGSSSGKGEVLLIFKTSDNNKAFEVLS